MSATWTHLLWTDLLGHPHIVRARTEALHAGHAVRIARADAAGGFASAGDLGHSATGAGPDLVLVPDERTERPVHWDPDVRLLIADVHEADGARSALCGRSALRRTLERVSAAGYTVSCAAELEFYLLDPATLAPVYPDIENYSITKGAEYEPILAEIRNRLREMDVTVEASNPEYSGGQFEVNILHGAALDAADRAILLRAAVRAIASRAGLRATFMAKPWTDQSGSGMHVHQSLWRGGQAVFHDAGDLSTTGRQYVAGLLRRMTEYTLLGSPTPNACHRRNDYSFSPTVVCWGSDNRTLAVRAITGSPGSTRVEQRDAAAEANPYLVFAGQLSAGLEGIADGLEPPEPTTGNAYARTDLERLPRSYLDAFDRLERSTAIRAALGGETVAAYLQVLAPERDLLLASSTDWERARYLMAV